MKCFYRAEVHVVEQKDSVAVIGDGWSALATVGFLATAGIPVTWIEGSGARIISPLAGLEWGPGVEAWSSLAEKLGVPLGELATGVKIREFRNKSFRDPMWAKGPTPEDRRGVRDELVWAPERQLIGVFEACWSRSSPAELDDEFRKILLGGRFPQVKRWEGDPVVGFQNQSTREICTLLLGSGKKIDCSKVVYADRWNLLPNMIGLPKSLPFLRKREAMGVLQATFVHDFPEGFGLPLTSYFAPLLRDTAKNFERHVWGHFSGSGQRSTWTVCLSVEEVDDNQEISKNLRRLKATLDRMFQGSDLIPAGKESFAATVLEEQVRFEEEAFFAQGQPPEGPLTISGMPGLIFMTDGYGPTRAFEIAGQVTGQTSGSINRAITKPTDEPDLISRPVQEADSVESRLSFMVVQNN